MLTRKQIEKQYHLFEIRQSHVTFDKISRLHDALNEIGLYLLADDNGRVIIVDKESNNKIAQSFSVF